MVLSMGVISAGNVFAESTTDSTAGIGKTADCTLEEEPQFNRYYEYGSELELRIVNPNPDICVYTVEYYDSEKNFIEVVQGQTEFDRVLIMTFERQGWPEGEYFISLKSITDGKSNGHYPLTVGVAATSVFGEESDYFLEDYSVVYSETTYSSSADSVIHVLAIEGKLPPSDTSYTIISKITDPNGNVTFLDQIFPNNYGYFAALFQIGEDEGFDKNGTYTISLDWELDGEGGEWEFEVTVDNTSKSDHADPQTPSEPVDSLSMVLVLFTLIAIALIVMRTHKKRSSSNDSSKYTRQCENCRGNWISVGTICKYCERMFNLSDDERILSSTNPYDILGIRRNSSQDEIKTAYHKLIKKYDPSFDSSNRIKEEQEILEKIAVKLHMAWERLNGK
jgi:hypothetical protein